MRRRRRTRRSAGIALLLVMAGASPAIARAPELPPSRVQVADLVLGEVAVAPGVRLGASSVRRLTGAPQACISFIRTVETRKEKRVGSFEACTNEEQPPGFVNDLPRQRFTISGRARASGITEIYVRSRGAWKLDRRSTNEPFAVSFQLTWLATEPPRVRQPAVALGVCYWLLVVCVGADAGIESTAAVEGHVRAPAVGLDVRLRASRGLIRYF